MGHRLKLTGEVVQNKMQKTVVVRVSRKIRHPKYGKILKRVKKYYAHSENPIEIGEKVTIEEVRPMSKLKRWVVLGQTDEPKPSKPKSNKPKAEK